MELYEYEVKHGQLLRGLAPECMVLLKSDGTFPLEAPGKVALYGSGARETIKGGTGSGDVNVRHYTTVEEGLENAGFTVTTKAWLDGYSRIRQEAYPRFVEGIKAKAKEMGVPAIMLGMGAVMPEPEYDLPLDGEGDTGVFVLGRISGEGSDRAPAPGDFELTQSEIRDILAARKLGVRRWDIVRRHMLVHLMPQFLTGLILLFPHAILHEASVTFLGFGLSSEQPAIGVILSESMRYLTTGKWWLALFPGISLVIVVLLFALLGERIRLLLDPASAQE